MSHYGFIITRHVNSEQTNKYWNQAVKLIRRLYPLRQIVIIDDNSDPDFVKADFDYQNLTIIQSEHHKRGELLPFYYYLKYKWFTKAVIIHDSLFIHKKIKFETFSLPVIPLWHHAYDKDNVPNIRRIVHSLKNNRSLLHKILEPNTMMFGLDGSANAKFNLCFGCQCFIQLNFLEMLERKYNISNLINAIHNRPDRCALERVMGLLFCVEYPQLVNIKSLFGDIVKATRAFNYTYDDYTNDINNKHLIHPFVKVWTGR